MLMYVAASPDYQLFCLICAVIGALGYGAWRLGQYVGGKDWRGDDHK